jgi:hypothetical protein
MFPELRAVQIEVPRDVLEMLEGSGEAPAYEAGASFSSVCAHRREDPWESRTTSLMEPIGALPGEVVDAKSLKDMVGPCGLEPQTSTVSRKRAGLTGQRSTVKQKRNGWYEWTSSIALSPPKARSAGLPAGHSSGAQQNRSFYGHPNHRENLKLNYSSNNLWRESVWLFSPGTLCFCARANGQMNWRIASAGCARLIFAA